MADTAFQTRLFDGFGDQSGVGNGGSGRFFDKDMHPAFDTPQRDFLMQKRRHDDDGGIRFDSIEHRFDVGIERLVIFAVFDDVAQGDDIDFATQAFEDAVVVAAHRAQADKRDIDHASSFRAPTL